MRGVANDCSDIQSILQFAQDIGARVNDGDFVGLFTRLVISR